MDKGQPSSLMLCVNSIHSQIDMGRSQMTTLGTITSMICARVPNLCIVQTEEHPWDYDETLVRQITQAPTTLAIVRSARIEAPMTNQVDFAKPNGKMPK